MTMVKFSLGIRDKIFLGSPASPPVVSSPLEVNRLARPASASALRYCAGPGTTMICRGVGICVPFSLRRASGSLCLCRSFPTRRRAGVGDEDGDGRRHAGHRRSHCRLRPPLPRHNSPSMLPPRTRRPPLWSHPRAATGAKQSLVAGKDAGLVPGSIFRLVIVGPILRHLRLKK